MHSTESQAKQTGDKVEQTTTNRTNNINIQTRIVHRIYIHTLYTSVCIDILWANQDGLNYNRALRSQAVQNFLGVTHGPEGI